MELQQLLQSEAILHVDNFQLVLSHFMLNAEIKLELDLLQSDAAGWQCGIDSFHR